MPKKWNVFDKFLLKMRYSRVYPYLKKNKVVADIGCGKEGAFLKSVSSKINQGFGFDFKLKKETNFKNIVLLNKDFASVNQKYDVVLFMAVLEHLTTPLLTLQQIHKRLNKGGVLLLTTPDKRSKWLLEFLSLKLHIINEEEILDHKHYFNKKELFDILRKAGFSHIKHSYFQLGLNNFVVAKKV